MTQNEVIKKLIDNEIDISIRTIQRYVEKGIIDKPKITRKGRAGGTKAEYTVTSPAEIAATWTMMNKARIRYELNELKDIRDIAHYLEENINEYKKYTDMVTDEYLNAMIKDPVIGIAAGQWLVLKIHFIEDKTHEELYEDYQRAANKIKNGKNKRNVTEIQELKTQLEQKRALAILSDEHFKFCLSVIQWPILLKKRFRELINTRYRT